MESAIEHAVDDDALQAWCDVVSDAIPDYPASLVSVRRQLELDPGATYLVARVDGRAIGAVSLARTPWVGDDALQQGTLAVRPDARRQGVGSALLDAALRVVRQRGCSRYQTWAQEDQPEALAFAERRGFRVVEASCPVVLRVEDGDAAEPRLPPGIEIASLAERPDLARAVYEIDRITTHDIPSENPPAELAFDEWRRVFLDRPGFRPEGVVVALDGGEAVGFAALMADTAVPGRAWHQMTAVLPSHRGRGLGEQLKRAQIRWARRAGLRELFTINHEQNAPMRAINARLGYQPRPRELLLQKQL